MGKGVTMSRWIVGMTLGMGIAMSSAGGLVARADDAPKKDDTKKEAAAETPLADRLKQDADNLQLLNEYMSKSLQEVFALLAENPDKADKKLDEMKSLLDSLMPQANESKQLLTRAKSAVPFYREQVELARTSLDELKAKVSENAEDAVVLRRYVSKLTAEINKLSQSNPDEAEKVLTSGREFLKSIREKVRNESLAKQVEQSDRALVNLQRSIDSAKKIAALVGKDAAALDVEAWVNGSPLTDADLKGKVVLLDFWAVWCGPCIATFPHLREWQEKYSDKGLVIVGLTRYYNFMWDEAAGRAVQANSQQSPADEQKMLEKFAAHHNLGHRFAVQRKEGKLDEYYGVRGIPHVVVIDQQGKVRMIRVGSGDKNAKDIGGLIEELLAKK